MLHITYRAKDLTQLGMECSSILLGIEACDLGETKIEGLLGNNDSFWLVVGRSP